MRRKKPPPFIRVAAVEHIVNETAGAWHIRRPGPAGMDREFSLQKKTGRLSPEHPARQYKTCIYAPSDWCARYLISELPNPKKPRAD